MCRILCILGLLISAAALPAETIAYYRDLQLEVYRPREDGKSHPIAIFVHGGGWNSGSRLDWGDVPLGFAAQGMVAVSIDYHLSQTHSWPAQVDELTRAIWWTREHAADLHADPARVLLVGASAGGQLVVSLANSFRRNVHGISDHPSLVISLSGIVDLHPSVAPLAPAVEDLIRPYLSGADPAEASPLCHFSGRTAPILFVHGSNDPVVPLAQVQEAYAILHDHCGVAARLLVLEGEGHEFRRSESHDRMGRAIIRFLQENNFL